MPLQRNAMQRTTPRNARHHHAITPPPQHATDNTNHTPLSAASLWAAAGFAEGVTAGAACGAGAPDMTRSTAARSTTSSTGTSIFKPGERVFHQKFGYGRIAEIEGNKLTIDFDKAGQKKVVDSFVERA